MNDITLITVSYNQKEVLELMLKSYVKHHYKGTPLKLWLADNNSTDETKEWLKSLEIDFVDCNQNYGHESQLNMAYVCMDTQYTLIADTDVEFFADTHDAYLPFIKDNCLIAGDLITGDQLNAPVKPRIGAWFMMFDVAKAINSGINVFRDTEAWDYDVGSHFTERVFEAGFTHHQIDRAPGNIDQDLYGMHYGTHAHFGKLSWDIPKHMDREYEINMRLAFVKERLKFYDDIDLKGKFE